MKCPDHKVSVDYDMRSKRWLVLLEMGFPGEDDFVPRAYIHLNHEQAGNLAVDIWKAMTEAQCREPGDA